MESASDRSALTSSEAARTRTQPRGVRRLAMADEGRGCPVEGIATEMAARADHILLLLRVCRVLSCMCSRNPAHAPNVLKRGAPTAILVLEVIKKSVKRNWDWG
jgi:hypothetical protein